MWKDLQCGKKGGNVELHSSRQQPGLHLGFFVSAHPFGRGLLYTDRVSSWKFLFSSLHRKLPLRPLKKTKHTEFTLKGDFFSVN